jgi:hypothetical protein
MPGGGGIGQILEGSVLASLWVSCMFVPFINNQCGLHGWMGWCGLLVAIDLVMLEISILDYEVGVNLTLSVVLLLNRSSLIPWYIVSSEERSRVIRKGQSREDQAEDQSEDQAAIPPNEP